MQKYCDLFLYSLLVFFLIRVIFTYLDINRGLFNAAVPITRWELNCFGVFCVLQSVLLADLFLAFVHADV
jgi:hypothetical protein